MFSDTWDVGSALAVAELGVRRVSSGSLPYRAAVDAAMSAINALREGSTLPNATPYREMQSRLVAFSEGTEQG